MLFYSVWEQKLSAALQDQLFEAGSEEASISSLRLQTLHSGHLLHSLAHVIGTWMLL